MTVNESRENFREQCVDRDNGECTIPWCEQKVTDSPDGPGEVHHIIERAEWPNGGYIPQNGACVCNNHHKMAEKNAIPPQAFWRWIGTDPLTPDKISKDVNKWGESLKTPPWSELRDYHKYPSTRHILPLYWHDNDGVAESRMDDDDTGYRSVDSFVGIPLVTTVKMDGSNAMLVKDSEEPVRSRRGRKATHESFDQLNKIYWDRNLYEKIPDNLQVFGEWIYAKHSIHYGCDGCCDKRNRGPALKNGLFQVIGVFDVEYNIWLSWPETEKLAKKLGFSTPTVYSTPLKNKNEIEFSSKGSRSFPTESNTLIQEYLSLGKEVVKNGHEGIIIRSLYPFHYAQFEKRLGKFVRPNHVQTSEHWSHKEITKNKRI